MAARIAPLVIQELPYGSPQRDSIYPGLCLKKSPAATVEQVSVEMLFTQVVVSKTIRAVHPFYVLVYKKRLWSLVRTTGDTPFEVCPGEVRVNRSIVAPVIAPSYS